MQKIKILYLIPTLASGGAERQLVELVNHIDRDRFDPLICLIYSERDVPLQIHPQNCKILNLEKPLGKCGNIVLLHRLRRVILRERPHIIHSYLNRANLYARIGALLSKHPCVITSVRIGVNLWTRFDRVAERILWRKSRRIIVNSELVKEELSRVFGIPGRKIHVISNGVDTNRFRPNRAQIEARKRLGLPQEVFLVGVVARYSPQKGYDCLLNALSLLRDDQNLRVLCIGQKTVPETFIEVRKLLQKYNLDDICELREPYQRIEEIYSSIDVLVLPSCLEGFPNVVLEAFACGKPVIVSKAANAIGIVKPGVNGWVFPTGDAKALADCIKQAMTLPKNVLEKMGMCGRKEVVVNYSSQIMARRVEKIYDQVIKEARCWSLYA